MMLNYFNVKLGSRCFRAWILASCLPMSRGTDCTAPYLNFFCRTGGPGQARSNLATSRTTMMEREKERIVMDLVTSLGLWHHRPAALSWFHHPVHPLYVPEHPHPTDSRRWDPEVCYPLIYQQMKCYLSFTPKPYSCYFDLAPGKGTVLVTKISSFNSCYGADSTNWVPSILVGDLNYILICCPGPETNVQSHSTKAICFYPSLTNTDITHL